MRDTLSEEGAHAVARSISFYWLQRGYCVETMAKPVKGKKQNMGVWQVRSDMINGHPVRAI